MPSEESDDNLPDHGIEVWGAALSVPLGPDGEDQRPVVRALSARISARTLGRLLSQAGAEGRLTEGGAELTVKIARLGPVTATLTASAPGNGRLRLAIASLRLAGRLPMPVPVALVLTALERLGGRPGLHRAGPQALDLDVGELLSDLPLRWQAGVRRVRVTRDVLEIECGAARAEQQGHADTDGAHHRGR